MTVQLRLHGGRLYLDAATSDRYLPRREAVTLFRRDDDLYIIPSHDSVAGGYSLKIRTSAGDRVVDAQDFFRAHGLDEPRERTLQAAWRPDASALVVRGIFAARERPQ